MKLSRIYRRVRAFTPRFVGYALAMGGLSLVGFSLVQTITATNNVSASGVSAGPSSQGAGAVTRQSVANANGLVAWWKLDGGLEDSSTNKISLTGSVGASPVEGKFSKGYGFLSGSNPVLTTSETPISGTGDFSGFMWVKTSISGARNQLLHVGGNGTGGGFWLSIDAYGKVNADLTNISGSISTTIVNDGDWHLVGAVYSGGTMQAYVDGVASGSPASMSPDITGGGVQLGYYGWPYVGSMDDVRIYNRSLSLGEITALYKGSSPGACDQSCVSWWKLDEGSGTSLANAVYGGVSASLVNTGGVPTSGIASGIFANGASLDGVNDSMVSTAWSDPRTNFSWSLWVKPKTMLTAGMSRGYTGIMGSYIDNTYRDQFFYQSNGYLRFSIGNGGFLNTIEYPITLLADTWYHLAVTRSGSDWAMYANGTLLTTSVSSIISTAGERYMTVGNDGAGSYGDISFDDVRVYNRAVTAAEIAEQYSYGK